MGSTAYSINGNHTAILANKNASLVTKESREAHPEPFINKNIVCGLSAIFKNYISFNHSNSFSCVDLTVVNREAKGKPALTMNTVICPMK